MGKKKQKFGFVQRPPAPPVTRGRHAVQPGAFNPAGELFDPEGRLLELVAEDVTLAQAQDLLARTSLPGVRSSSMTAAGAAEGAD